eukprot:Awhi_evm1s10905
MGATIFANMPNKDGSPTVLVAGKKPFLRKSLWPPGSPFEPLLFIAAKKDNGSFNSWVIKGMEYAKDSDNVVVTGNSWFSPMKADKKSRFDCTSLGSSPFWQDIEFDSTLSKVERTCSECYESAGVPSCDRFYDASSADSGVSDPDGETGEEDSGVSDPDGESGEENNTNDNAATAVAHASVRCRQNKLFCKFSLKTPNPRNVLGLKE